MIHDDFELIEIGPHYTEADIAARASEAEAVIVDAVLPVTAGMIEKMPGLKLIHSEGVSYNLIDTAAAEKAGVFVCNNRAVNAGQVAEHAVMLMLAVMRRLIEGDRRVRAGGQMQAKTQFIAEGLHDLIGARVGIIGFGAIGKELAKRLRPFGCKIFYSGGHRETAEAEAELGVEWLERDELLRCCDVVSLSVPVNDSTKNMINRETLALMKPGSILINCARGAVVNSADLAEAIRSGVIYGAGLDTMEPEPVPADDPLVMLPEPWKNRVVFTPHIAGTTLSVFYNSYINIWNNIAAVQRGERPTNVVNRV